MFTPPPHKSKLVFDRIFRNNSKHLVSRMSVRSSMEELFVLTFLLNHSSAGTDSCVESRAKLLRATSTIKTCLFKPRFLHN